MNKEHALAVFENYEIRRIYDEKVERWYFSVIDIIAVLIQQTDYQAARNYWKVLKNRLSKEGSQAVTDCNRLKMVAKDGKMKFTDVASQERGKSSGDRLSPTEIGGSGWQNTGNSRKVLTQMNPEKFFPPRPDFRPLFVFPDLACFNPSNSFCATDITDQSARS